MSITPTASISTISILSDILKDLPLASPIDYYIDDENQSSNLKLFDTQQQIEKSSQLLNSTDPYLVDVLNRTLSQIDTSKIQLKPSSENLFNSQSATNRLPLPPLIQTTALFNPKLFNGALNEQVQRANFANQQQQLKQPNVTQIASPNGPNQTPQQRQQQAVNQTQGFYDNSGVQAGSSGIASTSSYNNQEQQNNEYFVVQNKDNNKLSMKISKMPTNNVDGLMTSQSNTPNAQVKTETGEQITTNKFYSNKNNNLNEHLNGEKIKMKKETSSSAIGSQQSNSNQKKKAERNTAKNNLLSTWQANLTSQLALPDDFTPELISQLAAEGYDVVSAANSGRKPRVKQQHQQNNLPNLIDSSDEDEDNEYNPNSEAKQKSKSNNNDDSLFKTPSKLNRFDKSTINKMDCQDPTDHPSFKRFNQILDDLLESYEQDLQQINMKLSRNVTNNDEEQEEIPAEYLLNKQACSDLVQESFRLNSYGIMSCVRKENLIKLQNLLYFNIKDGLRSLSFMNEDNLSNTEQDKLFREILIEKLLRASDCSIISLMMMTSPKISKELIIEDIIEQISSFIKLHLTETIFPHYDPVYKPVAHSSSSDTSSANKSSKRKLINQFTSSVSSSSGSSSASKAKNMQHFYNRMREILSLIGELISQIDLTDTIIITLSSLSIMCFFVENINDLQLEALKILTNIFTRYSKHRQLVFDDILSSLVKLHPTKRNSRSYKCFNGDSIQMFSALLLQLLQCEVNTLDSIETSSNQAILPVSMETNGNIENNLDNVNQKTELTFEEKETFIINSYEESTQTAKKFLSVFFSKCKTKQADSDFRPIFENFIQDLLTTVNKPEWPVSEIILNLLGIILVNQIQNEQNDVSSRVNSLEYLGQIVSQLRKDSLEYQKYPEKVIQVLEKLNNTHKTVDLNKLDLNDDDIFNLQKSLINYLDSLVANDSSLQFSKYFLVGQWLKELNQQLIDNNSSSSNNQDLEHGQERLIKHNIAEENRKRLYTLIEKKKDSSMISNEGVVSVILDMNEAFILSKYLCSLKKTLDKNFDVYLVNILSLSGGACEANTPTQVRSKAIKCLSLIIEADPQILLKQKVFACVKSNFLHQTISVREASVDLIGRFITLKPELTNHYYELLSDRILDVGVSVRKRVIKIFRDVCLNQPDFEHLSEICVKILRRINDEDGIKKLVIDMFFSIWFSPINGNNRELLLRRVLNIVDVVSEFNAISSNASLEIFEQLFNNLMPNPNDKNQLASGGASSLLSIKEESGGIKEMSATNEQELQLQKSRDVIRSCKQIVDCLIENVLNTEANTSSPQAYKRLVASFSTLYCLSKIKPDNFINHAETLLPYLNIKSTNQNDNQIINSAARILECVIPLLQSPSNTFLVSLEESLCKLIFQGGMMIVSSCISCLGTVVNKLTKNFKLAADCFTKFYNNACYLKRVANIAKPLEQNTKPHVFRMLFTLGLLAKHFDCEASEFTEFKICSKQDLFSMFFHFVRSADVDVQHKALNGLGSFLTRYSEYMVKDEIKNLYLNYIKGTNVPYTLKSQIFLNITDYLIEEDQKNLAKSQELSKTHRFGTDDLKEMLDVQSGMASTIIQSYLKPILDSFLSPNPALRLNVVNCLSMILNQGLVYPIECVPYLIAMTTDPEKKVQTKALYHLTNLQKAHPGFVQSKSIAGVNISFCLQKIIKKAEIAQKQQQSVYLTEFDTAVRGFSESAEVLSLNHHLYSLLRTNRSYRRAFTQQLLKMFDDSSLHHTSLGHMLYITDNLAYFPYQLLDEPLYIIHQIDIIISVTGINLLQTFKENLLNHQSTSEKMDTKSLISKISSDNQLSDFDVNQDCPVEEDDEEKKMDNDSNGTNPNQIKKTIDDDEEESFEMVFNNLPDDIKVLKDCMYKAQGCCLLLILKQFLKEIYSINDSKIQNYSPTDTAKVNDRPITSRKTNRKFNPKQIIDYMKKSESNQHDDMETRQSIVREYLEFKELILSIDQEENKIDENKPNSNMKTNAGENPKLTALQQKLFEGIEKTKSSGSGLDSLTNTPRKVKSVKNKIPSSSGKKTGSNRKKKRKKDSDGSDDSDLDMNNSDFDDES